MPPQNYSSNPRDINIASPGVTQGELLARLQAALMQQQIDQADITASDAKAARTQARLTDPIEAMNTQDEIRRFQQRRDVVAQPKPIRGISAAGPAVPAAGPAMAPATFQVPQAGGGQPFFGAPTPTAAPAVVKGVRRITEGEPAIKPQTTAFGTATPRTRATSFGTGGLSALREGADRLADPNYAAGMADQANQVALNPAVMAAGIKADAASGSGGQDVKDAVAGMIAGTLPPQLPGRSSKEYVNILAEAKRQGYDLASAATDWTATQKHIATLNGAQQLRLNQAVNQLPDLLDSVDSLASQWHGSGFPLLNRASLAAAKAGTMGPKAATIANQLDAQIADVTSDLGNVYMGGNSPTDHALGLAAKSLSADWDENVLHDMVKMAKQNVQIRKNSINNTGVAGASAGNPYGGQKPAAGAPAAGGAADPYEAYLASRKGGT